LNIFLFLLIPKEDSSRHIRRLLGPLNITAAPKY